MIKAIIVDFYGVLFVKNSPFEGPPSIEPDMDFNQKAITGEVSDDDYIMRIAKAQNAAPNLVRQWISSRNQPNRDLISLLDRTKAKKVLLSNGVGEEVRGLLEKYQLTSKFDQIIISSEVKLAKPDPEIFKLVLDKLQLKSKECLIIDDSHEHLEAAKELGFDVWFYTSMPPLQIAFQKLNLIT